MQNHRYPASRVVQLVSERMNGAFSANSTTVSFLHSKTLTLRFLGTSIWYGGEWEIYFDFFEIDVTPLQMGTFLS